MRKNIGLVVFSMILLGACSGGKTQYQRETPLPVTVQKSELVDRPQVITVSGDVEPLGKVNLGFMVPGKIMKIYVHEGDHVHAGQLIARLDTTDYHYALQIAAAKKAKADDQFRRLNQMYNKQSLTPSDYIQARETSRQADANYQLYLKHIRDTKLCAPISGIVGARRVDPGEIVDKGLPLFTLVNTDSVKVNVAVPESEITRVKTGLRAVIEIPALDTTVSGKVLSVGALADPASRTYSVKIIVPNPGLLLKTGMIAEARINTQIMNPVISIPGEAIIRSPKDITYCFVVDSTNNRAYRRRVYVGGLADSSIVITQGLKAGEQVVTGGQNDLRDGMPVQIVSRGQQ